MPDASIEEKTSSARCAADGSLERARAESSEL
jgi:hypothetical protein